MVQSFEMVQGIFQETIEKSPSPTEVKGMWLLSPISRGFCCVQLLVSDRLTLLRPVRWSWFAELLIDSWLSILL